jgi:hypothetical protein
MRVYSSWTLAPPAVVGLKQIIPFYGCNRHVRYAFIEKKNDRKKSE